MNKKLQPLFDYLDQLTGRAPLDELTAVMNNLDIDCDDVADFVRFSCSHYARNLLRAGDWYHALVMCWKNGQRSPIHDHAQSSCGVRVLRGVAANYAATFPPEDPFWQAKYYPFNLYSERKAREKLDYMHLNPVRSCLVARAADWRWSSATHYERGRDVGIPLRWIFEA